MKRLSFLVLASSLIALLLIACAKKEEVGIEWLKSMKLGKENAEQQDKPLVVYYRVADIDYCKKMENVTFSDTDVVSLAKDFLWVWVDGYSKEDLVMEYGVIAYPTTIFYSPQGEELARRVGQLSPQELLQVLKFVKEGRNEFAELEEKLTGDPQNVELLYDYALALRNRGETIKARDKFVEITELDAKNEVGWTDDAYLQIGVMDFSSGNASMAVESFEIVVERFPESESAPKALIYMGDAYQLLKEYDLALATYKKVMDDYPQTEEATQADYRIGEMQMLEKTVEAFTGEGDEEEEK